MIDELDAALHELYPAPADDPEALLRVRRRVLETAERSPGVHRRGWLSRVSTAARRDRAPRGSASGRRAGAPLGPAAGRPDGVPLGPAARRRGWLPRVSLAAAAAVLAVAVIAVTVRSRTPDGAMVLVAQTLNTAADAPAQAVDEPVPAGAYRYIAVHTMTTVSENELTVLAGIKSELWVPADPAGEWFRLESDTGEWVPLVGTEEQLKAARLGPEKSPPTRESGPCGAFTPGLSDMCTAPGTWQVPTAAFLAGLPRDPERLFDRLRDDTDGHGRDPDQEVLVYAADALRSGLVPADLRSALYRALAHLPTLRITERFATLDGRTGTALGIDAAGEQQEIVIDPATGAFIGERTRRTEATGSLPAGTVIHSSSVTYGIAKQPWSPPTT